jgi:hypothetical protein
MSSPIESVFPASHVRRLYIDLPAISSPTASSSKGVRRVLLPFLLGAGHVRGGAGQHERGCVARWIARARTHATEAWCARRGIDRLCPSAFLAQVLAVAHTLAVLRSLMWHMRANGNDG